MGLLSILEHARSQVDHDGLSSSPEIDLYQSIFDQHVEDGNRFRLNIFTFHVRVPSSHKKINYVDVAHDHHDFDYNALLSHFIRASTVFNPGAKIWVVTGPDDQFDVDSDGRTTFVRLPVDSAAPMLERVRAMTAFVRSSLFNIDTIFLDTDAFPNASLCDIFTQEFDVGVTERPTEGFYMPLNEGVIFAKAKNLVAVRAFFAKYINTYNRLREDAVIYSYYGNIDRWRGGQLSLNAVAGSEEKNFTAVGLAFVRYFQCEDYNHWVRPEVDFLPSAWDVKCILHLKGDSKYYFDKFKEYHLARLHRVGCPEGCIEQPGGT